MPEVILQVRWDRNCVLAGFKHRVENGADDRVRCLLEYGSGNPRIGCDGEKFNRLFN